MSMYHRVKDGTKYPAVMLTHGVNFLFSSRRRHTRFDCDWSSDVCSSDLQRRNLLILLGQKPRAVLDLGHLRSEAGEGLGHLGADRAAADYGDRKSVV